MSTSHELIKQIENLSLFLQKEYEMITVRSKEDPGTAGDQGEMNWANVLINWLPQDYHVVTKGRLINEVWETSPQVDIIILYPFYPRYLLEYKLYHTSWVVAAFECKNTLRTSHIPKIIKNSIWIRNLMTPKNGWFRSLARSPIIYSVLAHSHDLWENPLVNLWKQLCKTNQRLITNLRQFVDFICVADLDTLVVTKSFNKNELGEVLWEISYWSIEEYKGRKSLPIGRLLIELWLKLSQNDSRLEPLADYFQSVLGSAFMRVCVNHKTLVIEESEERLDVKANFQYSR